MLQHERASLLSHCKDLRVAQYSSGSKLEGTLAQLIYFSYAEAHSDTNEAVNILPPFKERKMLALKFTIVLQLKLKKSFVRLSDIKKKKRRFFNAEK